MSDENPQFCLRFVSQQSGFAFFGALASAAHLFNLGEKIAMDEIRINKRGQITIPKTLREKYGWSSDIPLEIHEWEGRIVLQPAIVCHQCKKPLSEAFRNKNACPNCPPPTFIKVY